MKKSDILEQLKHSMNKITDELTMENLEEKKREIDKFFQFAISLKELPFEEGLPSLVERKVEQQESSRDDAVEKLENPMSGESVSQNVDALYTFERKVRGGMIQGLEGGYIVPEKMVRDMGVQHMDKVRIISSRKKPGEKTMYWFEVVEKVNAPNPSRIEYKLCSVEREYGEYVVKTTLAGDIKVKEIPFTFVISEADARTFDLSSGDIVDIAFYESNPTETMKVLHKYSLYEEKKIKEYYKQH